VEKLHDGAGDSDAEWIDDGAADRRRRILSRDA
jgi:hypothetical protein